uniref:Polyprotein n=1 Tax=Sclerotium rolfsii endornavirus 1 TaxID=2490822 RepID=A0A3G8EWK2_9VIRU|nr:polyprotein [Sclerotium rolfsii endornavirus 1]
MSSNTNNMQPSNHHQSEGPLKTLPSRDKLYTAIRDNNGESLIASPFSVEDSVANTILEKIPQLSQYDLSVDCVVDDNTDEMQAICDVLLKRMYDNVDMDGDLIISVTAKLQKNVAKAFSPDSVKLGGDTDCWKKILCPKKADLGYGFWMANAARAREHRNNEIQNEQPITLTELSEMMWDANRLYPLIRVSKAKYTEKMTQRIKSWYVKFVLWNESDLHLEDCSYEECPDDSYINLWDVDQEIKNGTFMNRFFKPDSDSAKTINFELLKLGSDDILVGGVTLINALSNALGIDAKTIANDPEIQKKISTYAEWAASLSINKKNRAILLPRDTDVAIINTLNSNFGSMAFLPSDLDAHPHPYLSACRKAITHKIVNEFPRSRIIHDLGGAFDFHFKEGYYNVHSCFLRSNPMDEGRFIDKTVNTLKNISNKDKNRLQLSDSNFHELVYSNPEKFVCGLPGQDCHYVTTHAVSFGMSVDTLLHVQIEDLLTFYAKKKIIKATHAITVPSDYLYKTSGQMAFGEASWKIENGYYWFVTSGDSGVYKVEDSLLRYYLQTPIVVAENFVVYMRNRGMLGSHYILDHYIMDKTKFITGPFYNAIWLSGHTEDVLVEIPIIDTTRPVSLMKTPYIKKDQIKINTKFMEKLMIRMLAPTSWESLQVSASSLVNTTYITSDGFTRLFKMDWKEVYYHCVVAWWQSNKFAESLMPLVNAANTPNLTENWWSAAWNSIKNFLKETVDELDPTQIEVLSEWLGSHTEGKMKVEDYTMSMLTAVKNIESSVELGRNVNILEAIVADIDVSIEEIPTAEDIIKTGKLANTNVYKALKPVEMETKNCGGKCPHNHEVPHHHVMSQYDMPVDACSCCKVKSSLINNLCMLCNEKDLCMNKSKKCKHHHTTINDECCNNKICKCVKPYRCACCELSSQNKFCRVCMVDWEHINAMLELNNEEQFRAERTYDIIQHPDITLIKDSPTVENRQLDNGTIVVPAINPIIQLDDVDTYWHAHLCSKCNNAYAISHIFNDVNHPVVVGECPYCGSGRDDKGNVSIKMEAFNYDSLINVFQTYPSYVKSEIEIQEETSKINKELSEADEIEIAKYPVQDDVKEMLEENEAVAESEDIEKLQEVSEQLGVVKLDDLSVRNDCLYFNMNENDPINPINLYHLFVLPNIYKLSVTVTNYEDNDEVGECGLAAMDQAFHYSKDDMREVCNKMFGHSDWLSAMELGALAMHYKQNLIVSDGTDTLLIKVDNENFAELIVSTNQYNGQEHWVHATGRIELINNNELRRAIRNNLMMLYLISQIEQNKKPTMVEIVKNYKQLDKYSVSEENIGMRFTDSNWIKIYQRFGGTFTKDGLVHESNTFKNDDFKKYVTRHRNLMVLEHPTGFGKTTKINNFDMPNEKKIIISPNIITVKGSIHYIHQVTGQPVDARAESQWFTAGNLSTHELMENEKTKIHNAHIILMTVNAAFEYLSRGILYPFENRLVYLDEVHDLTPTYLGVARLLGNNVRAVMSATFGNNCYTETSCKVQTKILNYLDVNDYLGTKVMAIYDTIDACKTFAQNIDSTYLDPKSANSVVTSKTRDSYDPNITKYGAATNAFTTGATFPNVNYIVDSGRRLTMGIYIQSEYVINRKTKHRDLFETIKYNFTFSEMMQTRGRVGRVTEGTYVCPMPVFDRPYVEDSAFYYAIYGGTNMPIKYNEVVANWSTQEDYRNLVSIEDPEMLEVDYVKDFLSELQQIFTAFKRVPQRSINFGDFDVNEDNLKVIFEQYVTTKAQKIFTTRPTEASTSQSRAEHLGELHKWSYISSRKCVVCGRACPDFLEKCGLHQYNLHESDLKFLSFPKLVEGNVSYPVPPVKLIDTSSSSYDVSIHVIDEMRSTLINSINTMAPVAKYARMNKVSTFHNACIVVELGKNKKLKEELPGTRNIRAGEIVFLVLLETHRVMLQMINEDFTASQKMKVILNMHSNNHLMDTMVNLIRRDPVDMLQLFSSMRKFVNYTGAPGTGKTYNAVAEMRKLTKDFCIITKQTLNSVRLRNTYKCNVYTPNSYVKQSRVYDGVIIDEVAGFDFVDFFTINLNNKYVILTGDRNQISTSTRSLQFHAEVNDLVAIDPVIPNKEFHESYRFGENTAKYLRVFNPKLIGKNDNDLGITFIGGEITDNSSFQQMLNNVKVSMICTATNARANLLARYGRQMGIPINTTSRLQGYEADHVVYYLGGISASKITDSEVYTGLSRHRKSCTVIVEPELFSYVYDKFKISVRTLKQRAGAIVLQDLDEVTRFLLEEDLSGDLKSLMDKLNDNLADIEGNRFMKSLKLYLANVCRVANENVDKIVSIVLKTLNMYNNENKEYKEHYMKAMQEIRDLNIVGNSLYVKLLYLKRRFVKPDELKGFIPIKNIKEWEHYTIPFDFIRDHLMIGASADDMKSLLHSMDVIVDEKYVEYVKQRSILNNEIGEESVIYNLLGKLKSLCKYLTNKMNFKYDSVTWQALPQISSVKRIDDIKKLVNSVVNDSYNGAKELKNLILARINNYVEDFSNKYVIREHRNLFTDEVIIIPNYIVERDLDLILARSPCIYEFLPNFKYDGLTDNVSVIVNHYYKCLLEKYHNIPIYITTTIYRHNSQLYIIGGNRMGSIKVGDSDKAYGRFVKYLYMNHKYNVSLYNYLDFLTELNFNEFNIGKLVASCILSNIMYYSIKSVATIFLGVRKAIYEIAKVLLKFGLINRLPKLDKWQFKYTKLDDANDKTSLFELDPEEIKMIINDHFNTNDQESPEWFKTCYSLVRKVLSMKDKVGDYLSPKLNMLYEKALKWDITSKLSSFFRAILKHWAKEQDISFDDDVDEGSAIEEEIVDKMVEEAREEAEEIQKNEFNLSIKVEMNENVKTPEPFKKSIDWLTYPEFEKQMFAPEVDKRLMAVELIEDYSLIGFEHVIDRISFKNLTTKSSLFKGRKGVDTLEDGYARLNISVLGANHSIEFYEALENKMIIVFDKNAIIAVTDDGNKSKIKMLSEPTKIAMDQIKENASKLKWVAGNNKLQKVFKFMKQLLKAVEKWLKDHAFLMFMRSYTSKDKRRIDVRIPLTKSEIRNELYNSDSMAQFVDFRSRLNDYKKVFYESRGVLYIVSGADNWSTNWCCVIRDVEVGVSEIVMYSKHRRQYMVDYLQMLPAGLSDIILNTGGVSYNRDLFANSSYDLEFEELRGLDRPNKHWRPNWRGGSKIDQYFYKLGLRSKNLYTEYDKRLINDALNYHPVIGLESFQEERQYTLHKRSGNLKRDGVVDQDSSGKMVNERLRALKESYYFLAPSGAGKTMTISILKEEFPDYDLIDSDRAAEINYLTNLESLRLSYKAMLTRYKKSNKIVEDKIVKPTIIFAHSVAEIPDDSLLKGIGHYILFDNCKIAKEKLTSKVAFQDMHNLCMSSVHPFIDAKGSYFTDAARKAIVSIRTKTIFHDVSKITPKFQTPDVISTTLGLEDPTGMEFYTKNDMVVDSLIPNTNDVRVKKKGGFELFKKRKIYVTGELDDAARLSLPDEKWSILKSLNNRIFNSVPYRSERVTSDDYLHSLSKLFVPNYEKYLEVFSKNLIVPSKDTMMSWLEDKGHKANIIIGYD